MINEIFPHKFCINLLRRKDRWEESQKQFAHAGIESVERFDAVDGKLLPQSQYILPGELGILETHIKILTLAKEQSWPNILIFEDDVELHPKFRRLFPHYCETLPDDWEMLYFGGNHQQAITLIKKHIFKLNYSFALMALAIKNTMYDMILDTIRPATKQIDVYYAELQSRCKAYCFNPPLASQRRGFSDILNVNINYDFLRGGTW